MLSLDSVLRTWTPCCPLCDQWNWSIVNFRRSICCITAVRLKFISEIDVLDPQFSQIKFNIFAALEPLLGIINACLPVLPPVIAKLSRSAAFRSTFKGTAQKNSTGTSDFKNFSSHKGTGLVSSASTGRQFERLEDEYPLNDIRRSRQHRIEPQETHADFQV